LHLPRLLTALVNHTKWLAFILRVCAVEATQLILGPTPLRAPPGWLELLLVLTTMMIVITDLNPTQYKRVYYQRFSNIL
jgi:hypothetical protein